MGIDKSTNKGLVNRSTIYKYTLYLSSGHFLPLIKACGQAGNLRYHFHAGNVFFITRLIDGFLEALAMLLVAVGQQVEDEGHDLGEVAVHLLLPMLCLQVPAGQQSLSTI